MTLAEAMQYMTTASWLKGYAQSLDEDRHSALIHRLNQASTLLEAIWLDWEKENWK